VQINKACDWEAAAKNELDAMSPECVGLLNQASTQIGHVNTYDVYGDCVTDSGCPKDDKFTQTYLTDKVGGELLQRGKVPHRATYEVSEASAGGEVKRHSMMGPRIANHGPDACINSRAASSYLNQPAVQKALHVQQQESESNGQTCWSVCGTAPGWSYNSTRTNLPRDTYPLLVSNIRVTVYNGDWDACVPFTDGEGWTSGMQLPIKKPWHSWAYTSTDGADNQVAGYATEYDVSNFGSGSFQFITIKGGRHEVPETAPAQAYEMISRITGGEVF
jgi:cathepsin A (carboxypeptidase C)/serine carboxypeptidase-like clade 1